MPFGFFIRSRCFVRVERVVLKCFEVRYYHEFDSGLLWKETRWLQDDFNSWKGRNPKVNMLEVDDVVSTMACKSISTYTAKIK